MVRSSTRNPRKTGSSATGSRKKPPINEETSDIEQSSISTLDTEAKTQKALKSRNRRPPLPKAKKKKRKKEATNLDEDESPLKKKKLLERATTAIAIAASSPGRPRRRAATGKKKLYTEVDSATDDETSSDDDSDYGNDKNDKFQTPQDSSGKTNKRNRVPIASRKANAKNSSSPATNKAFTGASPTTKKTKMSPSVVSTPQGVTIGLTPIKDSVSKVWKNDGVDWRVMGAIDYDLD